MAYIQGQEEDEELPEDEEAELSDDDEEEVERKDRKSRGIRMSKTDYVRLKNRTRVAGFIHIDDYITYLMKLEEQQARLENILRMEDRIVDRITAAIEGFLE